MADKRFLDALPEGFRKRTLTTARLAGKLGTAYVKASLGVKSDPKDAEQRAAELVEQLGAMKGLVMKVGQMASYLPGSMPKPAQRVMAQLQASTPPLAFEKVREVVKADLGADPSKLFDDFEETPFAAASIGQVHRASWRGLPVAVKVQYPGVEDAIRSDLKTVGLILQMSTVGTPLDGDAMATELRERLLEECDYRAEAAWQKKLRGVVQGFGGDVPEVVDERSGRRVITTSFVLGASFLKFADTASREAKERAAETIFRTCFGLLMRHGVFNADPHPGNYLLSDDGRVTFLDFGCVRQFDKPMVDTWKTFAKGVMANDEAGFRGMLPKMRMTPKKGFDWDHQWKATRHLYLPFLTPGFVFTDEYVRESYDHFIFKNPNRLKLAIEREWLFLNRLQWGVYSLFAELGVSADWGGIWTEQLESSTELLA